MAKMGKREEKVAQLHNQLKRALADYANLQKRVEAEREQIIKFGESALLTKFLAVLDTLESAEKAVRSAGSPAVKQGLQLALEQFKKILREEGVEEIKTDSCFDPRFHEAVEIVQGETDNKIVEVAAKGFQMGERVLRAAKVKVAKRYLDNQNAQAQKEAGGGNYM
jgi:molecular chaperone GrpE